MAIAKLDSVYISTNGITLHVVQAGPVNGPLIILLHGFPEFWMGWNKQIDALVDAGFRVWLPDMRGYNKSDKPKGKDAYQLDESVQDIVGLIRLSGHNQAYLAGHDWGGAVAWRLAQQYPQILRRLVVVNCPMLEVLKYHMKHSSKQQIKSWYMLFLRMPALPEFVLSSRNCRGLIDALTTTSRKDSFTRSELDQYREAWRQPGALTGMLNWYRAMTIPSKKVRENARVKVKTLLIWGERDHALGKELAKPSIDLCDEGELAFIRNGSHWVLHERPDRVNQLMLDFLQ
jgi:pimeloyl-ACP methyl ester carboxylesterase